jgi:hypothetical protein
VPSLALDREEATTDQFREMPACRLWRYISDMGEFSRWKCDTPHQAEQNCRSAWISHKIRSR